MTLHKRRLVQTSTICFSINSFSLQVVATATLLVFLRLSCVAATHTTTNRVTSYPNFQHLNVPKEIASNKLQIKHSRPTKLDIDHHHHHNPLPKFNELKTVTLLSNDDNNNNKNSSLNLKFNLIHRDKLSNKLSASGKHKHDHTHRFSLRIQRDIKRVAGLIHRLSNTNTSGVDDYKVVESFGSDVVSGMDQGSGEYFIRLGVGSPPRKQYVVIDSGSDIVWVQCQPCKQCYKQSDPVFNPAQSASYSGVSCSSFVCSRIQNSGCSHADRCRYEVLYSDGSYTKGNLAFETITIGGTVVRNVAMGCGHSNQGMFVGAAGLLGLGGGSMSFLGQLGGQTGGAFSYCLVSRGSGTPGSLVFGREAMPVGAAWINLVRSPRAPSFYYIGLMGLGVGGVRVPLPEGVFDLNGSGDGGVVMDTGTAVTRFPTTAYQAFRDSFLIQTANLPRASGVSIFDTCYNLAGFGSVRVPTVSFYFTDGPILTLPAKNFLIPIDEAGTFCFAFAPSSSGLSIIGNIQQEGIQISIDGSNGFVGFGPNIC
ncbi:protein ASPARTIC PROTEASE IN GUARD CELL 2-like isoform X2 [Chenopodium quinoa]|uniref:protein ASPARTIC PROTEASE IN GUARD CELL 2-like isoform X1 n=1 Tax=Chenopodium quinoa TaxID=63459 RepID=UPI000B7745BC|nr:protein ASPARTIC PROTEASE IN GUARD CELL 2-like isoform X1 [Chenopodium quinoa]XP_021750623.1 protein ASPARTIC PROTEASE IN GUARD CELL 2-like isoform X2 [Chenopodium quinoa]